MQILDNDQTVSSTESKRKAIDEKDEVSLMNVLQ